MRRGQDSPIEVGNYGERIVMEYLQRMYGEVTDVRQEKEYQNNDTDFLVPGYGSVEVKTDMYDTGNLALELMRNDGIPGVFVRSTADFWYYVVVKRSQVIVFRRTDALLLCLSTPYRIVNARANHSFSAPGKSFQHSVMLVPIADLVATGKVRVLSIDGSSIS